MEYGKIEKGIPFKPAGVLPNILRQCEVGDSFLWPKQAVHSYALRAGYRISVRAEGEAYRIFVLEKL